MLITSIDSRNIIVAIDLIQAKALVEALRTLQVDQLVQAAESMYAKGGFNVTGFDVQAATNSMCAVVGFFTDNLRLGLPANQPTAATQEPSPQPDTEPQANPVPATKVWKM